MPNTKITRNPQKPLFIRSADEFLLKSTLTGAIQDLTLLQRGLWFAELALFSYLAEDQFSVMINKAHYRLDAAYLSPHGQALLISSDTDAVVVFRGSGERDWEELQADEKNVAIFGETIGKVHRCFKADVDELWPKIEQDLANNRKPLWFCGHSLGGAIAFICAQRCLLSYIRSEPEELHTFGSPRIGNKKYMQHVDLKYYRWVNNNDAITRVPATWLGYRHAGTEMYLDRQGNLRSLKTWERISDRFQGALGAIFKGKFDHAKDHSVLQYVDRIFALVRQENPICPVTGEKKPSGHSGPAGALPEPNFKPAETHSSPKKVTS